MCVRELFLFSGLGTVESRLSSLSDLLEVFRLAASDFPTFETN